MTKPSNQAAQRPAPKTPVTQEDVRRVQSRTAAANGGKQRDWTRRLQSTADKRAAEDAASTGGKHAAKTPGAKKAA
jgi:hypothetical protein